VGVSLAWACGLVLASDKAFFMLAFTQVGLIPDGGASAVIAAAVGRIRAMRMALLAERLPATEALSAGLVTAVYPAEEFDAEVDKVVSKLLAEPVVAYAKTKDAINATTLTEMHDALECEFRGQSVLLRSHDFSEGATAFQQRRTPNFTDR
jgi:enoyl-CoA hydratase/carnithine racemase